MLSQALALIHSRERAEATQSGRTVSLLDDLPTTTKGGTPILRTSIAQTFHEESARLVEQPPTCQ